jgi:hypothetical protein
MVVVKLMGGLGNQLFQYAMGRSLATEWDTQLVLDVSFLLDRTPRQNFVFRNFDLDLFELHPYSLFDDHIQSRFHQNSLFKKSSLVIKEEGYAYSPYTYGVKKRDVYLEGYWQSYKYFTNISECLRTEFQFIQPLNQKQLELSEKIKGTTSVCVNFRRTDFVTIPSAVHTHGVPSLSYYYEAIARLKQMVGEKIELFVFSDDIEWCQSHFKQDEAIHFVTHDEFKGDRFSSYLQLMTHCKHFIIPNSTFGWWAAWLSDYSKKIVITPDVWFTDSLLQSQTQDLRPENWIKIKY